MEAPEAEKDRTSTTALSVEGKPDSNIDGIHAGTADDLPADTTTDAHPATQTQVDVKETPANSVEAEGIADAESQEHGEGTRPETSSTTSDQRLVEAQGRLAEVEQEIEACIDAEDFEKAEALETQRVTLTDAVEQIRRE